MLLKKLQMILILLAFGFGLSACGDSDEAAGGSSASESVGAGSSELPVAADGSLPDYDPDVPSMVVEDNGAVQQDEIYSNWPE